MISLLVTLVVICLIAWLLWWVLSLIPIPAPFNQVVKVLFAVIIVLAVIYEVLLPLAHVGLR